LSVETIEMKKIIKIIEGKEIINEKKTIINKGIIIEIERYREKEIIIEIIEIDKITREIIETSMNASPKGISKKNKKMKQ
jgi:hypothetical protein